MSNQYPKSIAELDLDAVQITPEILAAVKRFARSKPYRGSIPERIQKFTRVIGDILHSAGVPTPHLLFQIDESVGSGSSGFIPHARTIILRGRLSVITTLHEIAHMLFGPSEYTACSWSLRLFRDCFPRSWAKLDFDGHMAQKRRADSRSNAPSEKA